MSFGPQQLNSAVSQLDAKIAELETAITNASSEAQARVSRDLKRAWESVYNALSFSPNPAQRTHSYAAWAASSSPRIPAEANAPLEPEGAKPASMAEGVKCSLCLEDAKDVLWVCASCKDHHRVCNKCKVAEGSATLLEGHQLIAWPIGKRTIGKDKYVICDHCSKAVVGLRWTCTECSSFDMCNDCLNKTGHKHPLAPVYLAETAVHPMGTATYTCNSCDSGISPPIFCCLKCNDFHLCNSCIGSGKACQGHDFAAVYVSAASPALPRENAKSGDAKPNEPSEPSEPHAGPSQSPPAQAACNECAKPISGIRHRCTRCKDYDMCDDCYRSVTRLHPGHGFVHFGPPMHQHGPQHRHDGHPHPHPHGPHPHPHPHGPHRGHRGRGRGPRTGPGHIFGRPHHGLAACRLVRPPFECATPQSPHLPPVSSPHTMSFGPPHPMPGMSMDFPPPPPHIQPIGCMMPKVPPPPPAPMTCPMPPPPMRCPMPPPPPMAPTLAQTADRGTDTESEDDVSTAVVHPGVYCDACEASIVGVRYKCGNCVDYDLCEKCGPVAKHNKDHLFVVMRQRHAAPTNKPMLSMVYPPIKPARRTPSTQAARAVPRASSISIAAQAPSALSVQHISNSSAVLETRKYGAVFVEDVTMPDGTAVAPNEHFVKIWSVANMGDSEWPSGTMLVHLSGEPTVPGNKKAVPVVIGKRYEQIGIAVDLVAPSAPGRYTSQWRLMTSDGHYFGTDLWCVITVEESPAAAAAATVDKVETASDSSRDLLLDSASGLAITDAASAAGPALSAEQSHVASVASSGVLVNSKLPMQPVEDIQPSGAETAPVADNDSSSQAPAAGISSVESGNSASISSASSSVESGSAASIDSLSNTFVKIGADLMGEIRRLEQSIKEMQLRQDMLDVANNSRQHQATSAVASSTGASTSASASASASVNRSAHHTFDVSATPTRASDEPMKGYPLSVSSTQDAGNYTSIDLLTSPPLNASNAAMHGPSLPRSPSARSDTSSMRDFYSSAARLEQLLDSSRSSGTHVTTRSGPSSGNLSPDSNDGYELINDFASSPTPSKRV